MFGSALVWSFGGTIGRFIHIADPWTVVFWRSAFASLFLLGFLLWRDGVTGTVALFRAMRWPSLLVALCFSVASTSFVVALQYTTVANILLIQAGVPLLAALISRLLFNEHVTGMTWVAIAAVIFGIAVMVSESIGGTISPVGDGLAILIAVMFAIATVTTRRHTDVRMMPAVLLGTLIAALAAFFVATDFSVSGVNLAWLIAFGALNLGLGLALFATGARLTPAPLAALVGTMEPVIGPIWVWLFHSEVPSSRGLVGGSIVFAALMFHLIRERSKIGNLQ